MYSQNEKELSIQLSPNDTCQFNYFSHEPSPYRWPLDDYDSLDIEQGSDVYRYKYKDHTGPFDMQNYLPIDTIVEKSKKKCDFYRYTFMYNIEIN